MNLPHLAKLSEFGFSYERGGAHTSRTMMLDELNSLLMCVAQTGATKADYLQAVVNQNCLGKRSAKTRLLTYRHLTDLYGLDPSLIIFRTLLYFWERDVAGRPLLALLCAYARDPILRLSARFILNFEEGETVSREVLEQVLDSQISGRFSPATLRSTAQNINSTWTKSGHLCGKVRKTRTKPIPTPGSISYALFLGFLTGIRGSALFQTEYTRLVDCSFDRAIELAEESSRKGWIVFKRIADVIEIGFPNFVNRKEMERVSEQN